MTLLQELHNEAMNFAELAVSERIRGKYDHAETLFRSALEKELAAVKACSDLGNPEPTFSVLHRSAATLALDCGNPRLAEQLATRALSATPPPEMADELRDLLETINFQRHLQLRGVSLSDDELQMSIAGNAVGFGMVHGNEFLERISHASKIFYRIVERRERKPFREKGRLKKGVKDEYELYMSVPRAASFAVTLKVGRPTGQMKSAGLLGTTDIIDEFMSLIDLVNRKKEEEIHKRIGDQAYYRNFIALSRLLAPDGENVNLVGFTTFRGNKEVRISMTRSRDEIPPPKPPATEELTNVVTVEGQLLFADATHGRSGEIKVVNEASNASYLVKVPEGMMADIVKPLWGSKVIVSGVQHGRHIELEDIRET